MMINFLGLAREDFFLDLLTYVCAKLCNEEDNKQLKNSKLSLRRVSYLGQEGMPQNVRAEHPLLRVLFY